jgi:hypothetical protein
MLCGLKSDRNLITSLCHICGFFGCCYRWITRFWSYDRRKILAWLCWLYPLPSYSGTKCSRTEFQRESSLQCQRFTMHQVSRLWNRVTEKCINIKPCQTVSLSLQPSLFLCYVEYKKQRKLTYIDKDLTLLGEWHTVYISKPAMLTLREDTTKYVIRNFHSNRMQWNFTDYRMCKVVERQMELFCHLTCSRRTRIAWTNTLGKSY